MIKNLEGENENSRISQPDQNLLIADLQKKIQFLSAENSRL